MTPHSQCPACSSDMTPATIGYVCSTCGHVRRYMAPPPPSPIEDQPRHTEDTPPTTIPEPSSRPQIINHHSSSHYRKRLQERLARLERPELSAPEDLVEEPLLEPVTVPEAPLSTVPVPSPSPESEPSTPMEPVVAIKTNATSELTPAEQAFLDNAKHRMAPQSTPDKVALSKAEALLAAAAAHPSNATNHTRVSLLVGSTIALVVFACFVGWQLLRPIDATPSKSPTPSATPSTSTKPQGSDQTKRDATRKTDLNEIAVGLEAYRKATGAYPVGNDIAVLYPLQETNPPYIARINYDPLTNSTDSKDRVKYGYTSDGKSFTLTANLENHQDTDTKDGQYIVKSQ